MTWFIGCDPGMEGAVALIPKDEPGRELLFVLDLPRTTDGRSLDIAALRERIFSVIDDPLSPIVVCMEEVHAVPRFGSVGSFKMGRGLGNLEAMFKLMGPHGYFTVKPQVWKKSFGLVLDKKHTGPQKKKIDLEYARQYFGPAATAWLARAKDHNRADALLIAEYARRISLGK